jgi:hypothetical protein
MTTDTNTTDAPAPLHPGDPITWRRASKPGQTYAGKVLSVGPDGVYSVDNLQGGQTAVREDERVTEDAPADASQLDALPDDGGPVDEVVEDAAAVPESGETPSIVNEPVNETAAPPPLKALSLWQPWASLIAVGAKRIETRSWPTKYRGPIAIHASAKTDGIDAAIQGSDAIQKAPLDGGVLKAGGFLGMARDGQVHVGGVVAVADLVDCVEFTDGYDPGEPERHFGNFTPGRFGFVLENVRPLPEPVDCDGCQKIWNLKPEIAAKVWAQVEGTAPAAAEPSPGAVPPDAPAAEPALGIRTTETPKDERRAAAAPSAEPPTAVLMKHLAQIEEAEREATTAKYKWELAKEEAAALKKEYDRLCEVLCRVIREYSTPAPLFAHLADSVANAAAATLAAMGGTATATGSPDGVAALAAAAVNNAAADPDGWKAAAVSTLSLRESLATKLADNGILNLEQLVAYQASRFETPKIKGVGDKAKGEIDDAMDRFWGEWRKGQNPAPAAETPPATGPAAAAVPALAWKFDAETESHTAANTAGVPTPDAGGERPAEFFVEQYQSGQWWADPDFELVNDLGEEWTSPTFGTVDEAKAWCEARNAALVAARDAKPAEPANGWTAPVDPELVEAIGGIDAMLSAPDRDAKVDQLLHDAERADGGMQPAQQVGDLNAVSDLKAKRDRLLAEAVALDPKRDAPAWAETTLIVPRAVEPEPEPVPAKGKRRAKAGAA